MRVNVQGDDSPTFTSVTSTEHVYQDLPVIYSSTLFLRSSFCPVLSSFTFPSLFNVSSNHCWPAPVALIFIMNSFLYVGPENVWWTQGSTTWVMILSARVSLTTTFSLTHTRLTCWEHRVLLYQASVAGAIRKVQTEHRLSSHTVPIRDWETRSEDRQEEDTQ